MTNGPEAHADLHFRRYESCALGDRTVGYVEYDHGMGLLVGQVADTPLQPAARVLAGIFIVKRVADTVGIVHERSDDELGDRRGDLFGKAGSWRCTRGRTSSRQRRPASVTRLRYGGTGERIGAGTPPRQCPARARPRERPRLWRHDVQQHHAATMLSTPPTPARPCAATPQRRLGLPDDGQAAPQLPARGQPPLRLRLPPDPRTRRSASLQHHQVCTTYRKGRRRQPSGVRPGRRPSPQLTWPNASISRPGAGPTVALGRPG